MPITDQDIKLCGEYGELFAQIQGDSVIGGRFLEGNEIYKVINAGNIWLQQLQDISNDAYIEHPQYNQHRSEFISGFTPPQDYSSKSNPIDRIHKTLIQKKIVAFQFGISEHAIVIELEIDNNFLNINVYNTGLGINYHLAQTKDGIVRKHACKRHRINLLTVANQEQSIREILELLFGSKTSEAREDYRSEKLVDNIKTLYQMMESLVLDYSGSEIDGNNSTLIIGQRSGTCVWKSYLRYMREKLMQKNPNIDFDLLFKYDIKTRSLLKFIEITTQNPKKIIISKELLYVLEFAGQNNLRLAQKLYKKSLLTESNIQAALDLSKKALDLKEQLIKYAIPEQKYEFGNDPIITKTEKPQYIQLTETSVSQELSNNEEHYQNIFPINSSEECIKTIYIFSDPKNNIINNHNNLLIAMDYLCPYLTKHLLNEGNMLSTQDATKLLNNLLELSMKYYECSTKDKHSGYSEKRKVNMLFISILSLNYIKIILGSPEEYSENFGRIIATFCHAIYELSRNSVIDDPELNILNQRVMSEISSFMNILARKKERSFFAYYGFREEHAALKEIYAKSGEIGLELFVVICRLIFETINFSAISLERSDSRQNNLNQIFYYRTGSNIYQCPTAHDIVSAIDEGHKIEISYLGYTEWLLNPADKYILGKESSIFRGGIIERFKSQKSSDNTRDSIQQISSTNAYIPNGATISREDVDDAKLQSMFAEESISLLRLSEFIRENHSRLNTEKYIHAIYLRLLSNNAIRRNLVSNPENVLTFIKTISSDDILGLEQRNSLSMRAIFILRLYYISVINILEFINDCQTDEVRGKIIIEINNTDLTGHLDDKIKTAAQHDTDSYKEKLTTLLAIKILSFKIKLKTNKTFSSSELLDLLETSTMLSLHKNTNNSLTDLACETLRTILLEIDDKLFDEIKDKIAKKIIAQIGYAGHIITEVEFLPSVKKLKITTDILTCKFDLLTNSAVIGEKYLIKIPQHFDKDRTFRRCFSNELQLCYTLSPNHIKFRFKNRNFDVFFNNNQIVIQLDDAYQLFEQKTDHANYFLDKIKKSILLDNNHEVYIHPNNSAIIIDRHTKETIYQIDQDYNVTREKDLARLTHANPDENIRDILKGFEHEMFIAIWELQNNPENTHEILLPRYNITILYNSNSKRCQLHIGEKNYEVITNNDLKKLFPHALTINGHNDNIKVLLPKQYYVERPMTDINNIPTMMYDNFGAIFLSENRNIKSFLLEMANPQHANLKNTQEYIDFDFKDNKPICNTAENYFALSYYLIGQEKFSLAHQCLSQGIILSSSDSTSPSSYAWLKSICIDYPKKIKYESICANQITSQYNTLIMETEPYQNEGCMEDDVYYKQYSEKHIPSKIAKMQNNHHVALRALAFYFYALKTNNIDELDPEIIAIYYSNINNISTEYRLSLDQEYILLAILLTKLKSWGIEHKEFELRYEYVKAKIHEKSEFTQKDETQGIVISYETIHAKIDKDMRNAQLGTINNDFSNNETLNAYQIRDSIVSKYSIKQLIPMVLRGAFSYHTRPEESSLVKYILYILRSIITDTQNNKNNFDSYILLLMYTTIEQCMHDKNYAENLRLKLHAKSPQFHQIEIKDILMIINPECTLEVKIPTIKHVFKEVSRKVITITDSSPTTSLPNLKNPIIDDSKEIVSQLKQEYDLQSPKFNGDDETWLDIKDPDLLPFVESYRIDFRKGQQLNQEAKELFGSSQPTLSEEELDQTISTLKHETKEYEKLIVEKFNITPENIHAQIARITGEKPILNLRQIIHIFAEQSIALYIENSFMTFEQCEELNQLIFNYLYKLTYFQQLTRSSSINKRAYSSDEDPKLLSNLLVYEAFTEIRLRPQQATNIKILLDRGINMHAILQIPMGDGKSKVIIPISAMANADGKNLSVVVEPKALYKTTAMDLSLTAYKTFGKFPLTIDFDRNRASIEQLSHILHQLESAIKSRTFVIMTPDTIHSLYLTRNEYIITKSNTNKLEFLNQIFTIFNEKGIVIIDEIHQSLDIETDYDYASLDSKPLNKKFPLLQESILEFYTLLIDVPYLNDFTLFDVILGKARKPRIEEWPDLKTEIVKNICNNPKSRLYELAQENPDLLKAALLGESRQEVRDFFASRDPQKKEIIALYQREVTELLELTIDSAYLEEYGHDQSKAGTISGLIAMPHDRQMPVIGAEFSDPVITINYTIQSMFNINTSIPKEIIVTVFNDWLKKYYNTKREAILHSLISKIKEIFGFNEDSDFMISQLNDPVFINNIHKNSFENIKLKLYILSEYIMPTMTESDYELWSKPYTLNNIFKMVNGFSGTIENQYIYHPEMIFANKDQSLGTDGKVIDLLVSRKTNVLKADTNVTHEQSLHDLITRAAENKQSLHAIIDLGAAFKHIGDNEKISTHIGCNLLKHEHFNKIKFVLYFKDNGLIALDIRNNFKTIPLPNTNPETIKSILNVKPEEYFTFYGQAQTTGIDIQQADNAHAIVTIGENSRLASMLQAVKRMRKFDINGMQTIEIFVSTVTQEKNPLISDWSINSVLSFTLRNTLITKLDMNYRAAQLLMQNSLVRQILAKADITQDENADLYAEILKVTPNSSLADRYINFQTTHLTSEALRIYKEKLLIIARHGQLDAQRVERECNRIIEDYKKLCAPEVSSTLNSADVKSLRFVSRQAQESEQQETNMLQKGFASSATPIYKGIFVNSTQDIFEFYIMRFSYRVFQEQTPHRFKSDNIDDKIFTHSSSVTFITSESSRTIKYGSLLDFYECENAPTTLEHITKDAYYIAHIKRKGGTLKYLLLTEEEKSEIVAGLCGLSKRNSCPWKKSNNYEVLVYTQKNNLEYSSKGSKEKLDVEILMRASLFNADLMSLINIFEDPKSKKIFIDYFSRDKANKLAYLQYKVNNFKPDQAQHLDDITQIFQEIEEHVPNCISRAMEYTPSIRFSVTREIINITQTALIQNKPLIPKL